MRDGERKPPLRAEEVTGRVEEDPQKGSLGYAESSRREGKARNGRPRKGYDIGQMFLPVVIGLVLTFLIVFQYSASKSSLNTLDDNVNIVHEAAQAQQEAIDENTRVGNNLNNAIGLYAKKTELGDYITLVGLDGYVKSEDLPDLSGFLVSGDLSDYVTRDELPDSNGANGLTYSLSGTHPEFTLTVTSPQAGTYVAKVTLVYPDTVAVVGSTHGEAVAEFYSNLASPNRRYEPVLLYDNSQWWLSAVLTRTSAFTLESDTQRSFGIAIGGLGAYTGYTTVLVEVLPGLTDSGGGGSI